MTEKITDRITVEMPIIVAGDRIVAGDYLYTEAQWRDRATNADYAYVGQTVNAIAREVVKYLDSRVKTVEVEEFTIIDDNVTVEIHYNDEIIADAVDSDEAWQCVRSAAEAGTDLNSVRASMHLLMYFKQKESE